jgi:signal transduction histidine kinase
VVLNLIVNAAHAIEAAKGGRDSGQLGRIVVKTRRLEQEVEVSVADDGAGIPLEIQNRIFEPFFTTKPVGKGSGQGLAIAHAVVVEKHKGRLEVESAPGQGTTFRIYLPLEQPAP